MRTSFAVFGAIVLLMGCARGGGGDSRGTDGGSPGLDASVDGGGPGDRDAGVSPDGGALCDPGTADCGEKCADLGTDRSHCGACGNACAAGEVCSSGVCSSTCTAPTNTDCGGTCVDTTSDIAHCGACDTPCDGGKVCSSGSCVASCPAPSVDCGGSCVDVETSVTHCGGCDQACPTGASCAGGACACPAGQVACDGVCIDPQTSAAHCGASGTCAGSSAGASCPSGEVCSGGTCIVSCPAGTTRCGAGATLRCADTLTDADHCGGCDMACPGAPNAAASCAGASCDFTCTGAFQDCDMAAANGCEVDPSSDNTHCGACDNACPIGQSCQSGSCVATPEVCGNGADDDRDGDADCADSDCESDPSCTGGLCDGLVTRSANTGTITDGSGSSNYANSMSCAWQVTVPGAAGIELTFDDFALEGCCDYVTVYEGTSTAGTRLGRFNGTTLPARITAAGPSMHVTFTSDSSVTRQGFSASYAARTTPLEICTNGVDEDGDGQVDCDDDDCSSHEACSPVPCAGTVDRSAPSGVIQDGSGSSDYPNSASCAWRVQVPGSASIQLDFSSFELEGCCDYVRVYEGTSTSGTLLGSFNGASLPPRLIAAGDALYVTFSSDSSIVRDGFVATYTARDEPPEDCTNGVDDDADMQVDCLDSDCAAHEACTPVPCSGNVSRTAPTGVVQDGSGSANYTSNQSCSWTIDVAGATGIALDFSEFELESCCDYVTVHEGGSASGTQLGRFNGTSLPSSVMASGGQLYITFTTDSTVQYDGFRATYSASF